MNMDGLLPALNLRDTLLYLLAINVVAFLAMWIDKSRAKKGEWRISENTLFFFAIIGGSIGSIAGMYTFRHKTKKVKFILGFPLILIVQVILVLKYFNVF